MISRLRDAGIYRWIRSHQFAHFCCVICWSVLFPIRSNTLARHCCWLRPGLRPHVSRISRISRISAWMWGSAKCCLMALFKQLWACSTGLKKWAICRQHDHLESIFKLWWNNNVETESYFGASPLDGPPSIPWFLHGRGRTSCKQRNNLNCENFLHSKG